MSKATTRAALTLQHCESMRKLQRATIKQLERAIMGATTLPAAQAEVRIICDALHRAHMDAETLFRKRLAGL